MIAIRRARPDDAAALAEFGARTFAETFGPDNRRDDMRAYLARTYGEELQRREIEDPGIVTLIVEDGARMIGYAQLRCGAGEIEIARFYVD
jgi:diamine N-acetyltransferase